MEMVPFAIPFMLTPGNEPDGDWIVGSSAISTHDSGPPIGLLREANQELPHIWPTGIFVATFFLTIADTLAVASGLGDFLDGV
jgi:hypothetical protein